MTDAKDIFGEEPDSDEIQEQPAFAGGSIEQRINDVTAESNGFVNIGLLSSPRIHTGPQLTDKQLSYIEGLLDSKDIKGDPDTLKLHAQSLTKSAASQVIDGLLKLPDRARTRSREYTSKPSPEELPAGRYAIENEKGELRFYSVWRGTKYGKPDLIKVYVQHGPDESELPFKTAMVICKRIVAAGPINAALRYGKEIKRCNVCHIRLTNRISRELGIGPICGGRQFGDEFEAMHKAAREDLIARGIDPDEKIEEDE